MPRAAKTRIYVEYTEAETTLWGLKKGGFSTVPEAEQWAVDNIEFNETLRVTKVSGVFNKTAKVVKR